MGRLRDLWHAIHISEHGEYSPERKAALQQYQQRTSVARALAVCILTPLPSLCLVTGVEAALPLTPLADGWSFLSTLTLRVAICTGVMAFCLLNLARRSIPELRVTPQLLMRPAIATAILHTSFLWGYSALWVFPLPFAIVQTTGVFSTLCIVSFRVCLGTAPFQDVPDFRRRAKLYLLQLTFLSTLSMAYPAYGAFYRSQHGAAQAVIVVLPIAMKMIAKATVAKLGLAHNNDIFFLPGVVHCSVELLHTLFISTCVQTTEQPLQIMLVLVLFDFVPLASAYRTIADTIRGKHQPTEGNQAASFVRVFPGERPSIKPAPSQRAAASREPVRQKSKSQGGAVRMRRALYMCENHLLVEYLECVIPFSYAIYVVILYHLPNAQYYETMQIMQTPTRLRQYLASVAVLVGLQLLSVVGFCAMLSWRLMPAISSLQHLSYVLETQAEMIQMWFFTWMPICILSVEEHGGMDFSLRFAWIRQSHGA